MYRARSSMLKDVKMNYKLNPSYAAELWKCDHCMSMDSQSHIVWCPAHTHDMDLVTYFHHVMKIRFDPYRKIQIF